MAQSPIEWRRGPRSSFSLGHDPGVYALFLRPGARLPGIELAEHKPLYIGLAANRKGLKGRCHFDARTRNHSPRKSLAVLLMDKLSLTPVLISKPSSADTWGLDAQSDTRLSGWMHDNLHLAIEICINPDNRETELVGRYAPPLNLTKCAQTAQHRRISEARARVLATLKGEPLLAKADLPTVPAGGRLEPDLRPGRRSVGAKMDTAEAIADRFGLNPKSYRQRLRVSVSWYRKPQDWTFSVGSNEWRDMIAVAESMERRNRIAL
ncbi:MAG TPA: hypothetical protein VF474_15335 [Phenylobacterium sp.]